MPLLNKMYGILKIADITLPGFQTENVKKFIKYSKVCLYYMPPCKTHTKYLDKKIENGYLQVRRP